MPVNRWAAVVLSGVVAAGGVAQEGAGGREHARAGAAGVSPERMTEIGRSITERMERAFRPEGGAADYAAAAVEIVAAFEESMGSAEGRMVFGQLGPAWMTITGRYEEAQRVWEESGAGLPAPSAPPGGLEAVDAVSAIVEASRGRRVVMLNEAHHEPMHRAFGARVVRALAAEGFTHVAVEALSNRDAEGWMNDAVRAGRPVVGAGFYTREPMFGELLRAAFESGMTVFPYEATGSGDGGSPAGRINARDAEQAEHIARVLREDPGARVIVYCGYAHLTEAPGEIMGEEIRWLGLRLAGLLGTDPLTVSQFEFTPASMPERDSASYRAVAGAYEAGDVVALRGVGGGLWSATPGASDVTLVHPRREAVGGRPGFLFLGRERVASGVPREWMPVRGGALVQALVEGEDAGDAVPADQVWVEERGEATLALRTGRYRVRVFDSGAALYREERITVE